MSTPNIECVYRLRIDYTVKRAGSEGESAAIDKISNQAFKSAESHCVNVVENNTGGPCWEPYLIVESAYRADLVSYHAAMCHHITKHKGGAVI